MCGRSVTCHACVAPRKRGRSHLFGVVAQWLLPELAVHRPPVDPQQPGGFGLVAAGFLQGAACGIHFVGTIGAGEHTRDGGRFELAGQARFGDSAGPGEDATVFQDMAKLADVARISSAP